MPGQATTSGRCVRAGAACALLAAIASWSPPADADEIVPSLSVQTGVTFVRTPGNDTNDYFVAATPAISYLLEAGRLSLSIGYSFTGSLNTVLPNGIANRLGIASSYDLDPRTQLLFGAEALQALIGNYLLVRRAADTQIGGLPPLNTSLLTVTVTQGIAHEISPVTTLTQGVSGTIVQSLDPDVELSNKLVSASLGLDRSWEFDAVGGALNLQYARTRFPPIDSTSITADVGPTWDHDVSRTISTSAAVGLQVAFSPDPDTKPAVGPSGRASALYSNEGSGIEASYAGGIVPNLLLGTLLRSHQFTLRGFTPISERHNVVFGLSGGYLIAKTLDLRTQGAFDNEFDAVLHDADITWGPTDFLQLYIRYQFIGQSSGTGPGSTPAIVRHGALIGIELFGSRPIDRERKVQQKFPKRVDRGDLQRELPKRR